MKSSKRADCGVEAEQAQRGGALLAGGNVEREPFHGDAALARAQIGEPDEAEGKHGGGIAFRRAGDGRPAVLAVPEEGAREGGGEGVFQIGLGADLGQGPLRKLAPQEQAEALAEYQAAAALAELRAGAAAQVEQEHLALAAGEVFHGQVEARVGGFGDGGETAAPVARAVPGLQGEARAAHFQRVVVGGEGEQFLAGFEQGGLARALQEILNMGANLRQVAGDGGLHAANTASM